jgi:galactokinase
MDALICQKFKERFSRNPEVCLHAPSRINLIGEHTDYNGGWVLPASISYHISFAACKTNSDKAYIFNENLGQAISFEIDFPLNVKQLSDWQKFYYGSVKLLAKKYKIGGFQVLKLGNVPQGAGISSSAALACGFIASISKLYKLNMHPLEITKMAQQVEHEYLGVKCGIMDQFAVVFWKKKPLAFS